MPKLVLRLALALLCSAAASTAIAQPGPPPGGAPPRDHPPGERPGPDRPGQRLFVTPAGEPIRKGGLPAWFGRADLDHDGALTLAEFRTDAMAFFAQLDANRDGRIDGAENQAYETKIAPEILGADVDRGPGGPRADGPGPGPGRGERGKSGPRPGGERREGAARFGLLNEPQPVRGADADLDWKITADEWAKAAGRRFARLDGDNDGHLTLATLPPPGGRAPGRRD